MLPRTIRPISFSPTGTSRRCAEAIARAIARPTPSRPETAENHTDSPWSGGDTPVRSGPDTVEVRPIDLTHGAEACAIPSDSLALFAMPVYGGHIPPIALQRMERLRGSNTPAVLLVVYGNRAFERAAAELADFVTARGFVPIAVGAFVSEHSYSTPQLPIAAGRPDERDLAEAGAFGAAIRRKLERTGERLPDAVDAARLKGPRTPLVPMLRFIRFVIGYRRRQKRSSRPILPLGDPARCVHCGRCAALCPTEAITRGEEQHTDPTRCIRCCACVKGCPVGARSFNTPFARALARNFARRKPPVTLL